MDTQLGDGPDIEDEWAVDSIQSHAGSAENATFEMKWKSGDITWMPYYQIRHLQALDAYFNLLGVKNAAELSAGKGNPPREDPQVFLGAISLCPSLSNPFQQSLQFRDSFSFYKNPPLLSPSIHSYFQQHTQFLDQQSFSDNPCTSIQFLLLYFDDYFICSSFFFFFDYIDLFSEHINTLTPVTNFPPRFSDSHFDMRHLLSIQHLLRSEFGWRCRVRSRARRWLQLVGCATLLMDASNFRGPDGVGESRVKPRISLRRRERVKEK